MKYSSRTLSKALLKMIEENPDDYQKIIAGFAGFCKKKKLAHLLPGLLKYMEIQLRNEEGKKTFKIFSATGLEKNTIENIQKLAEAELAVKTELIEDKNIGAGFVAHYKNKIIDASLDSNLRRLKNKLIA